MKAFSYLFSDMALKAFKAAEDSHNLLCITKYLLLTRDKELYIHIHVCSRHKPSITISTDLLSFICIYIHTYIYNLFPCNINVMLAIADTWLFLIYTQYFSDFLYGVILLLDTCIQSFCKSCNSYPTIIALSFEDFLFTVWTYFASAVSFKIL